MAMYVGCGNSWGNKFANYENQSTFYWEEDMKHFHSLLCQGWELFSVQILYSFGNKKDSVFAQWHSQSTWDVT